jgi:hypothetical protein
MEYHASLRAKVLAAEKELIDSYDADVQRELMLVDDASSYLPAVMSAVGERTGNVELDREGVPAGGDIAELKLQALQFVGVRIFRVVRAARAALATGYEAETRPFDRILVELLEHRQAVVADETGKAALDWLQGKRGRGVGARVREMSPSDLYARLSEDSHGDPAPVARLVDSATRAIALKPMRTAATRASLLMHAGLCRDQAVVIAQAADLSLSGVEHLDAAVHAAWDALIVEADASQPPGSAT